MFLRGRWLSVALTTKLVVMAMVTTLAPDTSWAQRKERNAPSSAPSLGVKKAGEALGKALDPVALYANTRATVATIMTKDDLGFDAGQGSGFFIAPTLVGTRYRYHRLTEVPGTAQLQFAYLLTNYHVIRSAATAEVRLDDGRTGSVTDVVMEQEDADLAVVTVGIFDNAGNSPKPVATLGIAEGPETPVGLRVYAIGSPQGLETSLSEGIISGRREVAERIQWLQFTAPVSPGSSGGPLLSSSGEVIGVVTALRRGGQNLNFAVPASQVLTFLKGRCNSRELWRGSGIEEEKSHAYMDSCLRPYEAAQTLPTPDLRLSRADVQIRKGDYDGALRDLANVVPSEFGKYEYLVHYTIGHAAGLRGAKRTRGKPAKTVGELYELYRSNKDHQSAKKSLRKSIELNPEFSPAHYWLAVYLSCEGRFAEAFLAADSLVKRVPRCATAYKLRGGLHRDLDRNVEAYADFQTAADLGPNDPETYSDMAGVCSNLGEDAKEIDAYEAAIRLKSPTANVWYYNMGRAYQRMGKYEQALACYKKAKSLGFWPPGGDEEVAKCRERLK